MDNGFGQRLKKVRNKRGMTQKELGAACGVCAAAIMNWEKGLRLPNAYYLREICIALHVSADYLFGIGKFENNSAKARNKRVSA